MNIEHNKLNYVRETKVGVMHPSGDTIICEGSKECIGEEVVDLILHLIQVEPLVRVETYTKLADETTLACVSNVNSVSECSLHQNGCMVGTISR